MSFNGFTRPGEGGGSGGLSVSSTPNTEGKFDYSSSVMPTGVKRLNYSGYLVATKSFNPSYFDLAELFYTNGVTEAGDIVMKNPDGAGFIRAVGAYNKTVVGVHSDTYGQLLGGTEEDLDINAPIGLAGRVNVKVTGDVDIGDLIVCSDIPGVGMSAKEIIPGTIVGKALAVHKGDDIDRISMLILNM